jgi:hypothetical protein
VAQSKSTPDGGEQSVPHQKALYQKVVAASYYGLLGVQPNASAQEIRQSYRDLSKLYHPDTTSLPAAIATAKFQELNEAYATLSSPERRVAYDQKIGYSRVPVIRPLPTLQQPSRPSPLYSSSAYLDPTDRPLSPGEMFALFILGLTFVACLILAIAIGITRGGDLLQPVSAQSEPFQPISVSTATRPQGITAQPLSKSDLSPSAPAPVVGASSAQSPNSVSSSEPSHDTPPS